MKRAVLGFLILCAFASARATANSIRVCSFNIAQFGEGSLPERRNLSRMARMLSDANVHLICIQEVGTVDGGAAQVDSLTRNMNRLNAGDPVEYFFEVLPVTGDERYAVIYRDPVVQEGELLWLEDDADPDRPREGGRTFAHIPVAVPFIAEEFDFYVVILHLSASDKRQRRKEVLALRRFLRDEYDEGDWIVLGDMNRYLGFSESSDDKPFDLLLSANWGEHYRFPLLEAVSDSPNMKIFEAPEDELSTTIARGRTMYDQFILTAGAYREFGTEEPEIGEHVGILPFDRHADFASMGHNQLKFTISDHRPIWIQLNIDQPDDD